MSWPTVLRFSDILIFILIISTIQCLVTDTPDNDYLAEETSEITDHRFFLHEIFSKYGHDGQMTFEGFEHLLESLGLGNIITDHDVMMHKENDSFRDKHDTHDHSKKEAKVESATRRSTRAFSDDPGVVITSKKRKHTSHSHSVEEYTNKQSVIPPTKPGTNIDLHHHHNHDHPHSISNDDQITSEAAEDAHINHDDEYYDGAADRNMSPDDHHSVEHSHSGHHHLQEASNNEKTFGNRGNIQPAEVTYDHVATTTQRNPVDYNYAISEADDDDDYGQLVPASPKKNQDHGRRANHIGHNHDDEAKMGSDRNNLNVRGNNIPELLENITTLVDKHQELDEGAPEKVLKMCLSPREILQTFDISPENSLNPISFLHLCPAIIYELDHKNCLFHDHDSENFDGMVTLHQWLYAIIAVVIISLCGLFSVAVIPIMQKWFYHTMLQFLVGLAVGSLSGDGLLHLMPHAMLGEDNDHHSHAVLSHEAKEKLAVWRGLAALGGIFFFFIAERLLGAFHAYRKQKKEVKASRQSKLMIPVSLSDEVQANGNVGEKLSRYNRNSYDHNADTDKKEAMRMLPNEVANSRNGSIHSAHEVGFHGRSSFSLDPETAVSYSQSSECAVVVSEHHGHGHGHSHEVPDSVTAVAWMVIMGDGLHNFCDGLAIGAAFASGVEGGISTTVAVFCHELPHELGDFAMLLKTGMKVKQALFYNLLSSVLCFIGMVIGVSLGNVESATSWVFAGTAGMFLYIALVDMLPELASASSDPQAPATYLLAVQVLGMSIGISVMLLIANYEHDLKSIVS